MPDSQALEPLEWAELSEEERGRYRGKLSGLWGHEGDEAAYDSLTRDKQEALALISGRLASVDLWRFVGKIVNVYGRGGVGLYFGAVADLESELNGRPEFTHTFARHRDNTGGFIEKGRKRASFHFLYIDPEEGAREWHVHLDLYGPYGSLLSTAQHLYYERWSKFRPDWTMMKPWCQAELDGD
ncbi:MAG TPA: hypothetical protein VJT71_16340 [Pyrinomonadaceae bacterium]|nr:hypothetical protein [Pyrinomonadaceae bacterium]